MPPQTRASMTSLSASEKRSKVLGVGDLLLGIVNSILSVPKKFCSVWTMALLAQEWAEGWSGNGGVASGGGAMTGVAGSNSGVQLGSASVAGLPSVSASRIAVIGRQNVQWYLSFQQPM